MALTQIFLQDIKKSFEHAYLDIKIFWNSPDTPRNSTTVITIHYSLGIHEKNSGINWIPFFGTAWYIVSSDVACMCNMIEWSL